MVLMAGLFAALSFAGRAAADTTVVLKGVHLCCGGCAKAAQAAVQDIDGVKATCDRKAKTVTITAPDLKAAQKALDALAAQGFHGESDTKDAAIKEDSGATPGKVQSLTVSGAHNCCGACCKGLKSVLKKVEGVTGDTAKPKAKTFEVTGDFDAADLVKALNAAGYHVKVEKK
jgi:copper chaperone CopZ